MFCDALQLWDDSALLVLHMHLPPMQASSNTAHIGPTAYCHCIVQLVNKNKVTTYSWIDLPQQDPQLSLKITNWHFCFKPAFHDNDKVMSGAKHIKIFKPSSGFPSNSEILRQISEAKIVKNLSSPEAPHWSTPTSSNCTIPVDATILPSQPNLSQLYWLLKHACNLPSWQNS